MQDSLNILLPETSDSDFIEHHGVRGMRWGIRRYQKELAWKKRNKTFANIAADKRTGKITKQEAKSRRQVAKGELKSDIAKGKAYAKSLKGKPKAEVKAIYEKTKEKATREIPYNRVKKLVRGINNVPTALSIMGDIASGTTLAAIGAATANPALVGIGLGSIAISTPMSVISNRVTRGIQKRMYY